MGVTVSSHSTLAPISLGSIVVGFIAFAFTIATFLTVVWSSLRTLSAAPLEIEDYLGNLRQGLYEERAHLRVVRRKRRRRKSFNGGEAVLEAGDGMEDLSLKIMRDTVRDMIKQFRRLERPFLQDWDRENAGKQVDGYVDEDLEFYENRYRNCGLPERIAWLKVKGQVMRLLDGLVHVQVRRIAKEVGDMFFRLHEMDHEIYSTEQMVQGLDQRLSRVVGLRRVA